MERDFMGLNAKDSVVTVKEEVIEDSKDCAQGFGRSSGISLPLPSKNFAGAGLKQQKIGGDLIAAPYLVLPSMTPVVGNTEQWINSEASEVPTQLTIFYNGTVNVFDDISIEKVQAIMLLAGNGCILSNLAQAKIIVQAPISISGEPIRTVADRALANQSMSTPKCSGMPSPLSVTSHPVDQSSVAAANNDNIKVPNTIAMSAALANKGEPPIMVTSSRPMISSAVPQARKASLARFLEKRKERSMNAAPYNLGKNMADSATPESACVGFSATSGVGSCSVSSGKEINGDA